MKSRLLVIDNYDSFTYNLVQMFLQYDLDILVFRSDKLALDQIPSLTPDYLLVSPGPKDPAHAGISIPVIRAWAFALACNASMKSFRGGPYGRPSPGTAK